MFRKNLDFLQSEQGIESIRVLCDAIFAVHKNYDKALMNISRMDPAYCNSESGQREYESVQMCCSKKRLRLIVTANWNFCSATILR